MRTLLQALADRWPLPTQCEICRRWASQRVCEACIQTFVPPRLRCERCAMPRTGITGHESAAGQKSSDHAEPPSAPGDDRTGHRPYLGSTHHACAECHGLQPAWIRAFCAVDYGFPWDRLIQHLKFQGRTELAQPLSRLLCGAVGEATCRVDAVLPVPLSSARLMQRGYNQAWELAWRVARELNLPAQSRWLERPLEGEHQTGLGREERQHNLKGAFMVAPNHRQALTGLRLALVDDVLTTGATLQEATRCLLRAGAASVEVWTVARTA